MGCGSSKPATDSVHDLTLHWMAQSGHRRCISEGQIIPAVVDQEDDIRLSTRNSMGGGEALDHKLTLEIESMANEQFLDEEEEDEGEDAIANCPESPSFKVYCVQVPDYGDDETETEQEQEHESNAAKETSAKTKTTLMKRKKKRRIQNRKVVRRGMNIMHLKLPHAEAANLHCFPLYTSHRHNHHHVDRARLDCFCLQKHKEPATSHVDKARFDCLCITPPKSTRNQQHN